MTALNDFSKNRLTEFEVSSALEPEVSFFFGKFAENLISKLRDMRMQVAWSETAWDVIILNMYIWVFI